MTNYDYVHHNGDNHVTKKVITDTQTTEIKGLISYRVINLTLTDGTVVNDGIDTETVTVTVRDGLEVARGTDPSTATVLSYDGDVTLRIDGAETTRTITNGSVSFDLTTEKPTGSTIAIVAESLADHPAERDSAEIEVIQA